MAALAIAHCARYGALIKISQHGPIHMAETIVPHFHNEPGVAAVTIGAREFMCIGAKPPLDHPHVFLDMGDDNEIVCPYCSTLYRLDPALDARASRPAECAWTDSVAA